MSENPVPPAEPVQHESPEETPATNSTTSPDTPPAEPNPTEPAPTSEPEPVVEDAEPSPEPPAEEQFVSEGDQPLESLPVGGTAERAVTYVAGIEDEDVRALLMMALADQKAFSKDQDLRHRMQVSDNVREMVRWIRTNIPSSVSFKTFMDGVNTYLLMVETQGIPSMWSKEAASAPLSEVQARKAAMAIERAVEQADAHGSQDPMSTLKRYAQDIREGKIK